MGKGELQGGVCRHDNRARDSETVFNREDAQRIKSNVLHSVEHENSKIIVVPAHHDCEGNPVEKNEQLSQLNNAVATIKSWKLPVDVIGVWLNEQFQVVPIS